MARNWPWRHLKNSSAAQTHDDSGQKKSDQDSPAQGQAAPEQPAPDKDKSEAKPPSQDKEAKAPEAQEPPKQENSKQKESKENTKENGQPAAAEPSPAGAEANAPTSGEAGPAQAGPASESAQPDSSPGVNAPQTGTTEPPATGSAVEAAPTPTEKSNPSSAAKVNNHNHRSANRTRIVREGGTADATTLLSPSMTMEQASRQIQNTTQLLASAEANLQKVSTRKLNVDQQAMADQVHTYVQQAKDALSRGDLQRGYNLALKARLLADDLARH
jgi:hypothetical protein